MCYNQENGYEGSDFLFKNKKIPHIDYLPLIIITLISYKIIMSINKFTFGVEQVFSVFSFFIWAFVIAYLLNPMMKFLEAKLNIKRALSILIIYSLFISLVILTVTLITPSIVKSIGDLLQGMPSIIDHIETWLDNIFNKNTMIQRYNLDTYINNNINLITDKLNKFLQIALNTTFSQLISVTSILLKFFTGMFISIYMLKDKETIIKNVKKFITSLFSERISSSILNLSSKVNIVCLQYIVGKSLDSLLIGLLCFLGMLLLKTPYALLLSLFFGFTNMIPYFGNLIGAIPACIIAAFVSPLECLEVFIFLMVLQSFDGWFLSPKIIGKRLNLNPLWVLLGITVGGNLFGIVGMFVGVPFMAVVKMLLEEFMEKRIHDKNIPDPPQ